jgi:hypothetical protein
MKTREKPSGWTIAWLAWLIAFAVIEVPAVVFGKGASLTSHIRRRWFDETWERVVLAVAGVLLFVAHFAFGAPAWWSVIIGIVVCSGIIVAAEIRHAKQ